MEYLMWTSTVLCEKKDRTNTAWKQNDDTERQWWVYIFTSYLVNQFANKSWWNSLFSLATNFNALILLTSTKNIPRKLRSLTGYKPLSPKQQKYWLCQQWIPGLYNEELPQTDPSNFLWLRETNLFSKQVLQSNYEIYSLDNGTHGLW